MVLTGCACESSKIFAQVFQEYPFGVEGGTIRAFSNDLVLSIEPGTVSTNSTLVLRRQDGAAIAGTKFIDGFDMRLAPGPQLKPIHASIRYGSKSPPGPIEYEIRVYRIEGANYTAALTESIDTGRNVISVAIPTPGIYAAVVPIREPTP